MKLSELLSLHYARKTAAAVSALEKRSRKSSSGSVPFEATIHVQVPLDDEDDEENEEEIAPSADTRGFGIILPPDSRSVKARVREIDRLLQHHTPEEVERILWERYRKESEKP